LNLPGPEASLRGLRLSAEVCVGDPPAIGSLKLDNRHISLN
jgi:hypothetical protein